MGFQCTLSFLVTAKPFDFPHNPSMGVHVNNSRRPADALTDMIGGALGGGSGDGAASKMEHHLCHNYPIRSQSVASRAILSRLAGTPCQPPSAMVAFGFQS